jgi:hypothetical protein
MTSVSQDNKPKNTKTDSGLSEVFGEFRVKFKKVTYLYNMLCCYVKPFISEGLLTKKNILNIKFSLKFVLKMKHS